MITRRPAVDMIVPRYSRPPQAVNAFKASISLDEYCSLLVAPEMLKYNFSYDQVSGEIEFYTNDGAALARDLARVIDPGETSWTEILH